MSLASTQPRGRGDNPGAHCLYIDERSTGSLFKSERSAQATQSLASNDMGSVMATLSNEEARRLKLIESMALGEMHKLYKQFCLAHKGGNDVMVLDSGGHECHPRTCKLVPVNAVVYQFQKNAVHVCLRHQGYKCLAPANLHTGKEMAITDTLFVCPTSGKAHVCTQESCEAEKQARDGLMVCKLTGKVLGQDKLSHGWIEDEWRPVLHHKKFKPPKKAIYNAGGHVVSNIAFRATLEALSRRPTATDTLDGFNAYLHLYKQAHGHALKLIRELMHKSPTRTVVDNQALWKVLSRITGAWHKLAKTAQQQGKPIDGVAMQLACAQEASTLVVSPIDIDDGQLNRLCVCYANQVMQYTLTLLRHTQLLKHEVNWTDCVLAMIYLQTTRFRYNDAILIDTDPFLVQMLPPACTLTEFPMLKRHNFTNAKTAIQAALIEASDKGVSPSTLQLPTMRLQDFF